MVIAVIAVIVTVLSDHHDRSGNSTTDTTFNLGSDGVGFGSAGDGFASAGDGFGSGGAGVDDTTTTTAPTPVAPATPGQTLSDSTLFGPTTGTTALPGFALLGEDQTRNCTADVSPAFSAVLSANGCRAILRGLYVDSDGDILVAAEVIVLSDSTAAGAVTNALEASSTSLVNAVPVPLAAITPHPEDASSALPGAPATAGPAGAVQTTDPDRAAGGDRVSVDSEDQFVILAVGAYDNGQKATPDDERLGQATEDVSGGLEIAGTDGGSDTVTVTLGF